MSRLFVVLPSYNEEENIGEIVSRWQMQRGKLKQAGVSDLEIVAVDDGSVDDTPAILKQLQERHNNITVLTHDINKGLGQAVKTGMDYVAQKGNDEDYLCVMDADNTQSPVYIFDMLKAADRGFDCVIASRYRQHSEIKGVSPFRNSLSLGARLYYSMILGIPGVRDYTCGYRLYKVSMIKKALHGFGKQFIQEKGFSCMVEILYKIHKCKGKISEVPFRLRYDLKKGTSKMKVIRNISKSLRLAFELRQIRL